MPNWCYDYLSVTGPKEELDEYVKKSLVDPRNDGERKVFAFRGLLPTPEELTRYTSPNRPEHGETEEDMKERVERFKEEYGFEDWYAWNCGTWGTKWDVDSIDYNRESEDHFTVSFDSAWSPPIGYLENVSEMFPNLSFHMEFEEEGMGFAGECTVQNGEAHVEEREIEYWVVEDEEGNAEDWFKDPLEAEDEAKYLHEQNKNYWCVKHNGDIVFEIGKKESETPKSEFEF